MMINDIIITEEGSFGLDPYVVENYRNCHLLKEGDVIYAGNHLLFDFFGSDKSGDMAFVQKAMHEAVLRAGATALSESFKSFGEGCGFTGFIVLSESHISVHSWTETPIMSFDVYMCGNADPKIAYEYLKEQLKPRALKLIDVKRATNRITK